MAEEIKPARIDPDMLENATPDEFLEYLRTSKNVASARVQIPEGATAEDAAELMMAHLMLTVSAKAKRN